MIDLHTHALPGIDDGAKNANESMKMLADSFSQGIKVCALTPHCMVHGHEDVNIFLKRREESAIKLANIFGSCPVPELLLGAEVFLDHDISSYRGIKQLCLENTDYIMVELPTNSKPKWLSECVYSLGIRGIGVIIAHIDRYPYASRLIEELCGFDVCYQINSSRFLSFCDRIRLGRILKNDEMFFVSSDMHNMLSRRNTMKKAYDAAEKYFKGRADELFCYNAANHFNIDINKK